MLQPSWVEWCWPSRHLLPAPTPPPNPTAPLLAQVRPSTCVARQCGNMYTASIWSGIPQVSLDGWLGGAACGATAAFAKHSPASALRCMACKVPTGIITPSLCTLQLIETTGAALEGRRVLMYSYGSGISASMFSLVGRRPEAPRFALQRLQAMVRELWGSGPGELCLRRGD